jgi:hypothetical protein
MEKEADLMHQIYYSFKDINMVRGMEKEADLMHQI